MNYITLNTGAKMPLEGFGVFQIPDMTECEHVVYDAIKVGYRLFDTAAAYYNEEAVGKAIARAIADGLTTREELFIVTKLWVQDASYEAAKVAIRTSLEKLGLDYVDLYLFHQPMGDYFGAYRAMEEAYEEGILKAIGVANCYPAILANICETVKVIPAVDQVELHPFFQQWDALENMKAYGVQPMAWGPLAEGKHGIFTDPELTAIGAKYGKTAGRRSYSAGTSSVAWSSSRSPQSRPVWHRTWTSGTLNSAKRIWPSSQKRTSATVKSSITAIRPLSRL